MSPIANHRLLSLRLTWAWTLPLLVVFCWPLTRGPSAQVTPFSVGLFAVALAGLVFRPQAARAPLWWLAGVVALAWLGPGTELLSKTALLAAAAAAAVLFGMGRTASQRPDLLRAMVSATVLAMVFHSFAAWLQFFDLERALYPLVNLNPSPRAIGNLRQSNHLGTFAVLGLVGTWWRHRRGLDDTAVSAFLALLAYSCVVLSGSRTAVLEVVAVAICLALWRGPRSRLEWLVFLAGPLWVWAMDHGLQGLSALLTHDFQALKARNIGTFSIRWTHWGEAWQLALNHPVLGVGWGELGRARFLELPLQQHQVNTLNAHNLVLHALAEMGLVGGTLCLAPIFWVLWRLRPWARDLPAPHQANPVDFRWGWLVLVAVGLHSLTEYPLWYMPFIIPTAFVFGLLMAGLPQPARGGTDTPGTVSGRSVGALSAGLVLATGLALLDYRHVSTAYGPGGRSLPDQTLALRIQDTVLFRHYADRALLERVPMTPERVPELLAATERLLSHGPNTLLLWVRLAALCESRRYVEAQWLDQRFRTLYPKAHEQHARLRGPAALQACGLRGTQPR